MAYNPYTTSEGLRQLYETSVQTDTQKKAQEAATSAQMSTMEKQFETEVLEAEKKAQEALARQRARRSKRTRRGRGFLKSLVSLFLPGVGAAWSGIDAAKEQKAQGKHLYRMAELAKKHATTIDPRWGGTFLGSKSSKYLAGAEKSYGDLLRQAHDIKGKTGNPLEMLQTAVGTGLSSFATNKAIQGIAEKASGKEFASSKRKAAKETANESAKHVGELISSGMDKNMLTEAISTMPSAGGIDQDLLLSALGKGGQGNFLEELMRLFGEAGGEFGDILNTREDGGSGKADEVAGLLSMIESLKSQ